MKNEKCFDIGTIQAFIDGELASGLSEKVIKHISLCDSCAVLLAETEEENTLAFSVLGEELDCLVPTERLRTKVFDSIKEIEQKEKPGFWKHLTESLGFAGGFSFRNPGLAAFASVVLFVSAVTIGINFYDSVPNTNEVAVNTPSAGSFEVNEIASPTVDVSEETPVVPENSENEFPVIEASDSDKIVNEKFTTPQRIKPQKAVYIPAAAEENDSANTATAPAPRKASVNLAEEDGYLQTIATLKQSVDRNKDMVLRPTERVAYERDLAVVDDAIKKMKDEVRKNPGNQAAREVLRDSYKNKIDLLNSVAEKSELIASIQ